MAGSRFISLPRATYERILSRIAHIESIVGVSPVVIAVTDPGHGEPIPVRSSGSISLQIGAGPETNTLANPRFPGQALSIVVGAHDGGSRTITAASNINKAGQNVMVFNGVRDYILLLAVVVGNNLRWQVVANESVVLS